MPSRRRPFERLNDHAPRSGDQPTTSARLHTTIRSATTRGRAAQRFGIVPSSQPRPDASLKTSARDSADDWDNSASPRQLQSGGGRGDGVPTKVATRQREPRHTDSVYKRAIWLASDAVVLTIAGPFIAVWWVGRAIRRSFGAK